MKRAAFVLFLGLIGVVAVCATTLNSLPSAVADVVAANVDNQSFVFARSSTFKLDLSTGTWSTLTQVRNDTVALGFLASALCP